MKRILVSTDFSGTASAAFRPAVEMSRATGATISVLYVLDRLTYNTGYPYLDLSAYQTRIESLAAQSLERSIESLRELGATSVDGRYVVGTPHVEILREARRLPTDVVVMSTHGLSGFRRFVLGSTTERVVRKSTCPVLAVHAAQPDAPFKVRRVLFPTDLSSTAAEALPYAADLAGALGADLELLHVFEDPGRLPLLGPGYLMPTADEVQAFRSDCIERLVQAATQASRGDRHATWRVAEGEQIAETIVGHAKSEGFDLIVTPSHGRRGLEHMFLGSVAERVVRFAEVPVLVVKPEAFQGPVDAAGPKEESD